jgi:hypothetical protein
LKEPIPFKINGPGKANYPQPSRSKLKKTLLTEGPMINWLRRLTMLRVGGVSRLLPRLPICHWLNTLYVPMSCILRAGRRVEINDSVRVGKDSSDLNEFVLHGKM